MRSIGVGELVLVQATRGGDARATAQIAVAPKAHLFRVQLGCGWRKRYFCVRVSNLRGNGTDARLFVDITAAANRALAQRRSNKSYGICKNLVNAQAQDRSLLSHSCHRLRQSR